MPLIQYIDNQTFEFNIYTKRGIVLVRLPKRSQSHYFQRFSDWNRLQVEERVTCEIRTRRMRAFFARGYRQILRKTEDEEEIISITDLQR